MQQTTYWGDSPSKKIARYEALNSARCRLGAARFRTNPILVLAGPDGHDVPVLLALGVPHKNIHAFDINEDHCSSLKRRYPRISVVNGDALRATELCGQRFGLAVFDFCGPMRVPLLNGLRIFARGSMRRGGILSTTFLVGRDKEIGDLISPLRHDLGLLHSWHANSRCRVRFLQQFLANGLETPLQLFDAYAYHSKTHFSPGQPMFMYMGQLNRASLCDLPVRYIGMHEQARSRGSFRPYREQDLVYITQRMLEKKQPAQRLLALAPHEFKAFAAGEPVLLRPSQAGRIRPRPKKRHNPINVAFGKDLKAARQAAGLTQAAAALRLLTSKSTYGNWEYGHCSPSRLAYAKLLNVFPDLKYKKKPVTVQEKP